MKAFIGMIVIAACGSSVVGRPTYDVAQRGWIEFGGASLFLPAARCFEKTGSFRDARWLEDRARAVHKIYLAASPGDVGAADLTDVMEIGLDAGPPLRASRVIEDDGRWWGYWDDGAGVFVVALRCGKGKTCDVTMSVVRRTDGPDRFASSCVERWVGSATRHP